MLANKLNQSIVYVIRLVSKAHKGRLTGVRLFTRPSNAI